MASALAMYWDRKSAVGEGTRWLDRVLAMETPSDEELLFARAKARDAYAEFIRLNGDYSQAREMLHAALDDWRGAGERGKPYLASALIPSSRVALDQGDFDLAHALAMEALQVNTDLGDMAGLCQAYRRLADVALTRGELDFAGECLRNALRYAEECDSDHERCTTLRLRGDLARVRGDFDASRADYTRALELNENIKDDYADIRMSRSLGVVAVLEGDVARGMERIRYAARLCDTVGNYAALALAFSNAAMAAALTKETRRAMRLLGAMDNLVAQVQMQLIAPDSFEYERTMEMVKAQAEDRELECWRAEGRGLTYREALGELLDN
jgi:tetratricopeptide (TPR) repeat protein